LFTTLRGMVYAIGFVALWSWVAISIRPLDERLGMTIPTWVRPLGWIIGGIGAILAATCIWFFASRGRGTPAPFDPPREFVASGPYRYVRNPMYIGGLSVILGVGLILGSPSIVLLSLTFLVLAHLFVIFYEEPTLERRFGSSYLNYKRSVGRWLPKRPS
jgi:protein-S-isoprenylcysteine O-methyltransferase Ste14